MAKMIEIANWIVNYNLSLLAVLWMIIYSVPIFLMFIIPMSVMISVLLTFLRFSNDNEIIALKSGGQSFFGLLPAVALFCFMGFALNIFISVFGMPWANRELKQLTLSVAAANVDIGLKERTFNDSFKDVMLYVNKVDIKNKELIDVFIEDKRQPEIVSTVIAPRGKLYSEPGKFIFHLMLYGGSIHQTNLEDRLANWNEFDTYRLSLDLQGAMPRENDEEKHRTEMRPWELRQYIKNYGPKDKVYYKALLDYHRRFSIPAACFVFGLLAMPLGIHSKSAKYSFGLVLGLFFFLFYYLLLSVGMDFSKRAVIPAVVAMWLPNIVVGAAGVYFFMRASRE
jgi:lipopolysaccharide export system permease protein